MEIPVPRVRLVMDYIQRVWESLEGGQRCQFRNTIRFMMTSLVHAEVPARVMEAFIEWEQTTPALFASDASIPLLEEPSKPEEDLKKDPEEVPEEDSVLESDKDFVNGPVTVPSEDSGSRGGP